MRSLPEVTLEDFLDWDGLPRLVIFGVVLALYRPDTSRDWLKFAAAMLLVSFALGWGRAQARYEGRCELVREVAEELDAPHDDCNILRPEEEYT